MSSYLLVQVKFWQCMISTTGFPGVFNLVIKISHFFHSNNLELISVVYSVVSSEYFPQLQYTMWCRGVKLTIGQMNGGLASWPSDRFPLPVCLSDFLDDVTFWTHSQTEREHKRKLKRHSESTDVGQGQQSSFVWCENLQARPLYIYLMNSPSLHATLFPEVSWKSGQ